MKHLLPALFLLSGISSRAADQENAVTYEGQVTGVVCSSCKAQIKSVIKHKLPGVISVDVKDGAKAGPKTLVIIADRTDVTKESVTEALGEYGKEYQILSLAKRE